MSVASTMPAYRFAQMIALAEHKGYARPVAMQNLYNLLQREEEREMIPLCYEAGVGLIPYSPLARGVLAGPRKTERAREDKQASQNDLFATATRRSSRSWSRSLARARPSRPQIALAWCLAKPVMAAPIIGATKLSYLDDAAAATDIALTGEEIAALEAPYQWRAGRVAGLAAEASKIVASCEDIHRAGHPTGWHRCGLRRRVAS